ncbi:unnamed protein product [Durusdinium trenchii]|uniref:Uncharacterized protein n=1 Tax=Durusdinium trenchii TaxID=1381693 RepID=A0ABP0LEW8_9DINO
MIDDIDTSLQTQNQQLATPQKFVVCLGMDVDVQVLDQDAKEGIAYVSKLFTNDRLSREAFTFLAPENSSEDVIIMDGETVGRWILEVGHRLFEEGSLPGLPSWEQEDSSPELRVSLKAWEDALSVPMGPNFAELVEKAFKQAEAGFFQLGRLAPRLAALRWCSCMAWVRFRTLAVMEAGGNCSIPQGAASRDACEQAKRFIFKALDSVVSEREGVTEGVMYSLSSLARRYGMEGGKEPLPEESEDEWHRRSCEFDICRIAHQVERAPPVDVNASMPRLLVMQPFGTPHKRLRLAEVPRMILDRNKWYTEVANMPLLNLCSKSAVVGPILHMEVPPPPDFDLEDPEVRSKVERGEDLGKAEQEDGLPGALHGSVGLLYAALAFEELTVHFHPGSLLLEGLMEMFVHYGPKLRTISLAGNAGFVNEDSLSLLTLAGDTVKTLDLEGCDLDPSYLEGILNTVKSLRALQVLDLAGNKLDGPTALNLVAALCDNRIDLDILRLDGNPLGTPEVFKKRSGDLAGHKRGVRGGWWRFGLAPR